MIENSKFIKKLEGVIRQIETSQFMFDRQRNGLLNTLKSLESDAKKIGEDSIELGKINFHIGFLLSNKMFDKEESRDRISFALRINEKNTFLTQKEILAATELLTGLYIELGLHEDAIKCLEKIQGIAKDGSFDSDIRLGVLSQSGFYYHELGMYNEALKLNLSILEEAEEIYGPLDSKLINVTRNISENYYCLNKIEDSTRYQNKVIALAQHNNNSEIEVESLFKLGVLNYESGNIKKSKEYLLKSLDVANNSGDESLISFAKSNLDELANKTKKWWKVW